VLGVVDDIMALPALLKFVVQIVAALIPATGAVHNRMLGAAGGQIVEFAGRPRLYRPEKGGPILAFTVTDLRIRDTDEARMLRAGRTHG
jgi:hypothetical protein